MSDKRFMRATWMLVVIILAACGSSGSTPTPEIFAFPDEYSEAYDMYALEAQNIIIDYDVTIENQGMGRVFFAVRDPQGEIIWNFAITQSGQDTLTVPTTIEGEYLILVATENLEGRHGISYRRENR